MTENENKPKDLTPYRLDINIFSNILKSCIRGHQFYHNSQSPSEIIIPYVEEVNGVKVTYEQPPAKKVVKKA
jgi:hypothetical protein